MLQKDDFADFLDGNIDKKSDSEKFIEENKIKWPQSINALFDNIELWLKPYIATNKIGIQELTNYRNGNHWETPTNLEISFGGNKIVFMPEGNLMTGTFGRVTVTGKNAKMSTLIQPSWNTWKIKETQSEFNESTLKQLIQELSQ